MFGCLRWTMYVGHGLQQYDVAPISNFLQVTEVRGTALAEYNVVECTGLCYNYV